MTLEELREVAAKRNLIIPDKDEGDFLTLLRAADLAVKHVDALPPYLDPRLVASDASGLAGLAEARPFTKVEPEDNPLNAWSHKVSLALGSFGPCRVLTTYSAISCLKA